MPASMHQKISHIQECLSNRHCVVSVTGEYADCVLPTQKLMTKVLRAEADGMFKDGFTPSQARSKMKSSVSVAQLPTLKHFQNRYRHNKMLENNCPTKMATLLMEKCFACDVEETKYFSFGYDVANGYPDVGYGGDSGPFMVGVTTKALLHQMNRDPSTFIFHWDATYKINSKAFPVLICGISDLARQFHPVAFFLLSKESHNEYTWAMNELQMIYEAVVGLPLKIKYTMADAARAPLISIQAVADELGVEKILMCFYHCVASIKKKLGGVSIMTKGLVYRHVYNMHYSRSEAEMRHHWASAQDAWSRDAVLVQREFVPYFSAQWVHSEFSAWQVFHSPSGFSTTNNPCETFNKHFKDVYTNRQVHGLCATLTIVGGVAEDYSTFKSPSFAIRASPGNNLMRRSHRLRKFGLLEAVPTDERLNYSLEKYCFLEASREEANAGIQADAVSSSTVSDEDAAIANAYYYNSTTNNARHEVVCSGNQQPWYGWRVCTTPDNLRCECNYFYKHAHCCHLVFALNLQEKDMYGNPLPQATFDRANTSRRPSSTRFGGRSRSRVGGALSLQ
ncbi:hypothetical protein AeMF1_020278 [Aphanomyces euteiches]|nr:hypothetical protein AeMF1_020278 [Aphanomyces euteiches]KAH9188721.1 hypothetical protein AeNC1_009303 [Aphanomyces euteiches]